MEILLEGNKDTFSEKFKAIRKISILKMHFFYVSELKVIPLPLNKLTLLAVMRGLWNMGRALKQASLLFKILSSA